MSVIIQAGIAPADSVIHAADAVALAAGIRDGGSASKHDKSLPPTNSRNTPSQREATQFTQSLGCLFSGPFVKPQK